MRFLADMGVSPRCAEWLRSRGHDAIHLYEEGLHALPDSDVLCKAFNERRILLTMDLDFAHLAAAVGVKRLPTVVIFRLSDQRPTNVQDRLLAIEPVLVDLNGQSAVLSVDDKRIRIRRLPIK